MLVNPCEYILESNVINMLFGQLCKERLSQKCNSINWVKCASFWYTKNLKNRGSSLFTRKFSEKRAFLRGHKISWGFLAQVRKNFGVKKASKTTIFEVEISEGKKKPTDAIKVILRRFNKKFSTTLHYRFQMKHETRK